MALWDRIVSLFRSTPAPRPPRPRVHGRVVWGDINDLASPVPEALPPASELETPAPESGKVKALVGKPAVSLPLPDTDKVEEPSSGEEPPSTQELNELLWGDKAPPSRPAHRIPAPAPDPAPVDVRFLSYFSWLEDSPGYAEFSGTVEGADPLLCPICHTLVLKEDRLPLQSPQAVHRSCYQKYYDALSKITSAESARALFAREPKALHCVHWIHEHWPTYPPDWDVRRERVLKRAGWECEECGEREDELDVHHKIPIVQGGLHSPDNLICLCRDCHEKAHGRTLRAPSPAVKKESAYSRRMALLAEAMRDGTAVRFHYRDQKGKETDRVFSPKAWETRHGVQCVKGYCHLRGSSRTFVVRRMSKVAETN